MYKKLLKVTRSSLMLLYVIIVILTIIFEIYLCIDVVVSIIDRTKTILELTIEICVILIGVPLFTKILYYVLF